MSDKALEEATKFAKPLASNILPYCLLLTRDMHAPCPLFVYQRKNDLE
ncbi:MAG TPA: hypothetical protein VFR94_14050 [Nitrososphaeraceae archaeon]|nr:hypothetical protein [Nitrososphaeraceae archaeon]